jgi:hypothetical protein
MQGARYVHLIPWTLHSGSEHLVFADNMCNENVHILIISGTQISVFAE